MAVLINLLPWRRAGRQQRRRFRLCTLVSVIVLFMSSFWVGCTLLSQQVKTLQKQGDELDNQHDKLQAILHHQQGVQQQGEQQHQGGGEEKDRQYRVSRWGSIFTGLGRNLPENSWLRSVHWQSGMLTLKGYTSEMDDLEKIEALLKQLPGTFHVKAGPVRYRAAQGLTYVFMLEEKGEQRALP